ncbi:MAG: DUF2189 domain-containing protein [Gammaproteobacteria bacterium]|nr:DUF2189 domain-containing protein [Gammaproteobacteria bacterium]MCP5200779.1 DUF2189 domain-containing protein [Gammaproteobacteria bacterium]
MSNANDKALAEAAAEYALPGVRAIDDTAPLRWIGQGFDDILRAPRASLFYGAVLALMGWSLVTWYGGAVGLALTTGFLLMGPFLAVGIYEVSRQLERHTSIDFLRTLTVWHDNRPAIGFYALILMLSLAVWMRISVVLIALLVPNGFDDITHLLEQLLAEPGSWVFLLVYLAIGAVLAGFSFSISAVALPMLLDRTHMDAISAMITSFQAIRRNPRPMALWAALIVLLITAGFMSWFIGLVVIVPLIGHATWHAYRDVVEPARLPLRTPY